jgi:hypothetical protein
MSEQSAVSAKRVNFNTFLNVIVLSVTAWVGSSILTLGRQLTRLEAVTEMKIEQLNRIELELGRQRNQITELQLDLARVKGK